MKDIIPYDGKIKQISRTLRKNQTPAEVVLWARLRRNQLGYGFTRQKILGPYIVDFYCKQSKLVIEVDGSQHYGGPGCSRDKTRDEYLKHEGLRILRITDNEVATNLVGVMLAIISMLGTGNNPP